MKPAITPRWMTVQDAAPYCGLSVRTLHSAIQSEAINSHVVKTTGTKGGRRLIDRESLDAWIEGKPASAPTHRSIVEQIAHHAAEIRRLAAMLG